METFFLALGAMLIIGAGAGMVLTILYQIIRPGLLKQQPRQRANALLGWAVAPTCVGLFFTSLLFMPSVLNRLGIPAGHCHNHTERLPHICLTNPPFSGSETLPWYLVVALVVLIAGFLVSQGACLQKFARFMTSLRFATPENGAGYNLLPWEKPAAFTAGFWSPQIFISKTLTQAVSPAHLQVILAHEQGHVRRRDPLRQYMGQILSLLYLPRTRHLILEDLTLATEQACDEDAAIKTGDHLQVADAIVAVERLLHISNVEFGTGAVGFVKNNSAQRVQSLLVEGNFQKPSYPIWFLFVPLLAGTSLMMPGAIHSLIEYVIRH